SSVHTARCVALRRRNANILTHSRPHGRCSVTMTQSTFRRRSGDAQLRMSVSSFECLLKSLEPHIRKNYTNMRNPVEPVEMLGITLRYLGSGNSITDLHFKFKRGKSTIAYIIQRV
ncbi:jg22793, partial [Pararge aegeria aegeria]